MEFRRGLGVLARAGATVAVLVLWEWAARVQISFNFPTPAATFLALWQGAASGELLAASTITMRALILGLGAAAAFGVPFGLVMGVVRPVGRVARVYLDLLIALPTAALIPLIILTFGINLISSAAVVFIFSAPFITVNAYGGVRDVSPRLVEMARSFNGSWGQLFTLVILPAATPMILSGLRYGLSRAFVGVVVVELLLSPVGLGLVIVTRRSMFEYDHMFAAVIWTIALAVVLLTLLQRLEGRLLRWRVQA